jgi:hypothetical protein
MEIPDLIQNLLKAGITILLLVILVITVILLGILIIFAYGIFGIVGAILMASIIIIPIAYQTRYRLRMRRYLADGPTRVETRNYDYDSEDDVNDDDDLDLPTDVPTDYYYRTRTEKRGDNLYRTTIEGLYGAIWGYGSTPDESRDDAHRQYEHYRDEDRKRRKEEWLQKMKQKKENRRL